MGQASRLAKSDQQYLSRPRRVVGPLGRFKRHCLLVTRSFVDNYTCHGYSSAVRCPLMKPLRSFVTALTLLAVAAQPVAATMLPCCCTKHSEGRHACCQHRINSQAPVVEHSCCKHKCCKEKPSVEVKKGRGACCCSKAPPTFDRVTDLEQKVQKASLAFDCAVATTSPQLPTKVELSLCRCCYPGPKLQTLYCTWLN